MHLCYFEDDLHYDCSRSVRMAVLEDPGHQQGLISPPSTVQTIGFMTSNGHAQALGHKTQN